MSEQIKCLKFPLFIQEFAIAWGITIVQFCESSNVFGHLSFGFDFAMNCTFAISFVLIAL